MRVFSWVRVLVYAVGLVLLVSVLDLASPGRFIPNWFGTDTPKARQEAASFVSEDPTRSGRRAPVKRREGPEESSETVSVDEASSPDAEFGFFDDPDLFDSFFGLSPRGSEAAPQAEPSTTGPHPLQATANWAQDLLPAQYAAGSASDLERELQELEKDYQQAYHQLFDPHSPYGARKLLPLIYVTLYN